MSFGVVGANWHSTGRHFLGVPEILVIPVKQFFIV